MRRCMQGGFTCPKGTEVFHPSGATIGFRGNSHMYNHPHREAYYHFYDITIDNITINAITHFSTIFFFHQNFFLVIFVSYQAVQACKLVLVELLINRIIKVDRWFLFKSGLYFPIFNLRFIWCTCRHIFVGILLHYLLSLC